MMWIVDTTFLLIWNKNKNAGYLECLGISKIYFQDLKS